MAYSYSMYCKLFASLYQGTLRGRSNEILVFTNLLAHSTKEGTVDKHFRAIAEETGLSVDEVKAAITVLESPDEESRSPEENGARLVRLDEHRVWGWRVVNYGKYRANRSEDDRAEQNRQAQARWREKHKADSNGSKPPSAEGKRDKPMQRERKKQKKEEDSAEGEQQAAPTGDHSELIRLWCEEYPSSHAGEKYAFQSGKDGVAVKMLLQTTGKTPEEIMRVAREAWKYPGDFHCSNAASLSKFNANFNEVRAKAVEIYKENKNGANGHKPKESLGLHGRPIVIV